MKRVWAAWLLATMATACTVTPPPKGPDAAGDWNIVFDKGSDACRCDDQGA